MDNETKKGRYTLRDRIEDKRIRAAVDKALSWETKIENKLRRDFKYLSYESKFARKFHAFQKLIEKDKRLVHCFESMIESLDKLRAYEKSFYGDEGLGAGMKLGVEIGRNGLDDSPRYYEPDFDDEEELNEETEEELDK